MLKITFVKNYSRKCFSIHHENAPTYSSCFITLFWKTIHIRYSSKFNYFYIAKQVRRDHEILDSLSMCLITTIIQERTKKSPSSLVKITEGAIGHSNDYIFRGNLDGEDVFIKVILSRLNADSPDKGVMQNEYEKTLLASLECPHFVKPLHYIHFSKCEILISPFIQNIRPLYNVMQSSYPPPLYIREQLIAI
ncbi:hypothetical protein, partial [Mailhella sp.]|uniref:hypothetical protein n=1 Tax=Mailhella sp. TaxID=1981029 RepID=UPI0040629B23